MFLGVYPKPLLDRIEPSVNQLLAHVEHVNQAAGRDFHVATTQDGHQLDPSRSATDEPARAAGSDDGSSTAEQGAAGDGGGGR